MFKKILKCFVAALISASCCMALAGCGDNDDDLGGRTKLNFYYYEAGYGSEWATALCDSYNASQDKVKVVPYGDYDMFNLAKNEMERGTDVADIYTVSSAEAFARDGQIEDLTGLYSEVVETVDGKDYTMNDLVESYAKDAATFAGKTYGVPWFGTNMSVVYNVAMFEQNNWKVPATMEEFFALCETIRAANINPLVYCGSKDQGYIPTLLETWLWQAEGDDNMAEFLKFGSADVYRAQEASRTKIYQTVARMVKDPIVMHPNSGAYDNQAAQRQFILGDAAMIINGAWIVTEMEATLKNYPNFRMAIMPLPHINSNKKGADGTDTNNIIVKNANQYVIPKAAKHKEEAKDFLKWMCRQENLQMFAEKCNGTLRPFEILHPDTSALTEFGKSMYEMSAKSRAVVYRSDASIYRDGKVGVFMSASGEFVTHLSNQKDLAAAIREAAQLARQDYTIAKTAFENWAK